MLPDHHPTGLGRHGGGGGGGGEVGVVDLDPPERVNPDLAEGADPIVARICGVEREQFEVKLDLRVEDFLALATACNM